MVDAIESLPEELYGVPMKRLRRGVDCPHCHRFLKVNRKRLNRTMMQYLLVLYSARKSGGEAWVQASRIRIGAKKDASSQGDRIQTGDYKILAKWRLAELHPIRHGFVRITDAGVAFVEGRATVAESVFLENYKNTFVAFDGPQVTAEKAYGTSFSLADL